MREETIDIHNAKSRLSTVEQKIQDEKKILNVNKRYIEKYLELQKARGLKPTSMAKDLYSIWFVGCHIKKDFKKCSKNDIIKICGIIESQNWTPKTKQCHTKMIKKFWKWLCNRRDKNVYPPVVSWINTNETAKLDKLPEELLTEEEIGQMAQAADSLRDRALVLLSYETGARIGELLNIKIKHIVFNEFGAFVLLNGKTGMRRVPVVMSAPAIAAFIDHHPLKADLDSFLFLTRHNTMTDLTRGKYVPLSYRGADKILKTLAEKAGIRKRIYPHLFRHSSATRAAKFMTEAQMKIYYGWTRGSGMPSIYVHLSSRDVLDAVKKMNNMPVVTNENGPTATVKICPRCKLKNSFGSKFCNSCGCALDLKTVMEIEEKRKSWDDKLALLVTDPEVQKVLAKKIEQMDAQ